MGIKKKRAESTRTELNEHVSFKSITNEILRVRLFLKSTCRHNIGGMVRNRQALCGAVMHYQRQRGRRVRIQGHKGVR